MLKPTLHNHLGWMLDLETLGTSNNAIVTEVSAVAFEVDTGKIVREVTYCLSVDEQIRAGRELSTGTLAFWLEQADEARLKLLNSLDGYCEGKMVKMPVSLDYFLDSLREVVLLTTIHWEREKGIERDRPAPLVYGNGPRFDMGKVADLYESANRENDYPWEYHGDICVRTLHRLAPQFKKDEEFIGVPHFGLDDCKHQIKYITKVYQSILAVAGIATADES